MKNSVLAMIVLLVIGIFIYEFKLNPTFAICDMLVTVVSLLILRQEFKK